MKRILIVNRGEIARRIIATAHRMGLQTVAVHSDADANALHVQEATMAYALGGATSADSYLHVDKLLAAVRATGADAIHPGYGFLSEDADFAQTVQEAGLTWIGPPPAAIRKLGNKAAAKALATEQGVPCLPGYGGTDQSEERFVAEAEKIGYPVMVKAVAGGGGRGMRLVTEPGQLAQALASASSEALAGFGNGDLLIERAVTGPRHVEVQIFADHHANVVHMYERDCSMQRRHQKIIEEAPSPAVSPELRQRMGECAVALARGAGYVGAGTVEFLLERGNFFLMEMNTRLQVEHPVTEAITGLDLVEWQIRVARGEALPLTQEQIPLQGHAMEVRLVAEDENYVPHAGRILHFAAPAAAEFARAPLRLDHAIAGGMEVTPHYDAMLGKLVVHAATRAEAINRMIAALAQTEILGLPTNRSFLMTCLSDARFRRSEALISFLDRYGDALRQTLAGQQKDAHRRYAVAVACAPGGALPCPFELPLRLAHGDEEAAIPVRPEPGGLEITGEQPRRLAMEPLADGALRCRENDKTMRVQAVLAPTPDAPQRWHAQAGGTDWWFEDISFKAQASGTGARAASELKAPFNGTVVRAAVKPGQKLAAGDVAVVIESMKLEHNIAPRADVTVAEVLVSTGQQVTPGQLLVRFETEVADEDYGKETVA
ncbi:MAG: biotin carboxylase N-terminal domain-containing protein [Ottowia sp.]|nr:ATP-grasp domain-containing protein [Ottowia sp.]